MIIYYHDQIMSSTQSRVVTHNILFSMSFFLPISYIHTAIILIVFSSFLIYLFFYPFFKVIIGESTYPAMYGREEKVSIYIYNIYPRPFRSFEQYPIFYSILFCSKLFLIFYS